MGNITRTFSYVVAVLPQLKTESLTNKDALKASVNKIQHLLFRSFETVFTKSKMLQKTYAVEEDGILNYENVTFLSLSHIIQSFFINISTVYDPEVKIYVIIDDVITLQNTSMIENLEYNVKKLDIYDELMTFLETLERDPCSIIPEIRGA